MRALHLAPAVPGGHIHVGGARWPQTVQQGVDGKGRVQFGLEQILLRRGGVSGVHCGEWGDRLRRWFRVRLVSLQDVRGQVLCKNRLILARHRRVLPLEELLGDAAQLHGPEVAFTLRLTGILQHLRVTEVGTL